MRTLKQAALLTITLLATSLLLGAAFAADNNEHVAALKAHKFVPVPPASAYAFSEWRNMPLEVAKVFGRSTGCQDASPGLINLVSRISLGEGIDPRITAATIATESQCNPYAISTKGAVGLMQVRVSTWRGKFDFGGRVNLLNTEDNIKTGTAILASFVKQYGTAEGVRRYNGLGVGCDTCDAQYVSKVSKLAGRN